MRKKTEIVCGSSTSLQKISFLKLQSGLVSSVKQKLVNVLKNAFGVLRNNFATWRMRFNVLKRTTREHYPHARHQCVIRLFIIEGVVGV